MRALFILLTLTLVPLQESQAMKFNCEDSLGLSSKLEINTASKTAKYAAHRLRRRCGDVLFRLLNEFHHC